MRWMQRMLERSVCKDSVDAGGAGVGAGAGASSADSTPNDQLAFIEELLNDSPGTNDDLGGEEGKGTDAQLPQADEGSADADTGQSGDPGKAADPTVEVDKGQDTKALEASDSEQTLQSLREQILSLTEMLSVDPMKQSVKADVSSADTSVGGQATTNGNLADFLTGDELDRIIDEPALLNVAFQRSQQAMLSSMGEIIQNEVNKQILISRAISDFYTVNSDLLPFSKFVQFVMTDVENKNKDKTYGQIFETTASECRKRLGLPIPGASQTRQNPTGGVKKPAFAGTRSGTSRPADGKKAVFDENAADLMGLT